MWTLYDPLKKTTNNLKHNGVKKDVIRERPSTVNQMFFMLENVTKLGSKGKRFSHESEDRIRYI